MRDQFQTIDAATANALPHAPSRVLAVGSSMGGLISALEAQQGAGHIDGALSTCGIVAGGIRLNNYQLDGEYVIAKLLATTPIQLVNFFPDFNAGIATGSSCKRLRTRRRRRRRAGLGSSSRWRF